MPRVKEKNSFERKKRVRDLKTRRRETDNSNRGEYRIDTDAYLHEDKIREIMNMDQLEDSLAEVLTISSDDMDDMFSSPRLSTDSEFDSSKDDLHLNFRRQSSSEAMDSLQGHDLNFENETATSEIYFGLGFRSLGQVITKLQPFEMAHFNLKHTVPKIILSSKMNVLQTMY